VAPGSRATFFLGLRPQEVWAEQISRGYSRADDHPGTRKTKPRVLGDDGKSARSLNAPSK
jgi:hypothetical protein